MVKNFDSFEQLKEWGAVIVTEQRKLNHDLQNADETQKVAIRKTNTDLIRLAGQPGTLWTGKDDASQGGTTNRNADDLLNEFPCFITHFAGVLRTAFLYRPKVLLTTADVFGGIFFLALGPQAVLGLLGQSYKDPPALVISGMAPTMDEAFQNFAIRRVGAVKESAKKTKIQLSDTAQHCKASDTQFTLNPMEYCMLAGLNKTAVMTEDKALSQNHTFYHRLNACLKASQAPRKHNASTPITSVIAQALWDVFHRHDPHLLDDCNGQVASSNPWVGGYGLLARRWQEWIDAVHNGLVSYENQNDNSSSFCTSDFKASFQLIRDDNHECLEKWFNRFCKEHPDKNKAIDRFGKTLTKLNEPLPKNGNSNEPDMSRRTKAFETIDEQYGKTEGKRRPFPDFINLDSTASANTNNRQRMADSQDMKLDRQTLIDWYQFVYISSMAQHLGCLMLAVGTKPSSYEQYASEKYNQSQNAGERRQQTLGFSGSITSDLGNMPYTRFANFLYDSRTAIRDWRNCGPNESPRKQRSCTRNISYCVNEESHEFSRAEQIKSTLQSFVVAIIFGLVSVVFDNVVFEGDIPLWGIVAAAWVVDIIPDLIDTVKWWFGLHSASESIVYPTILKADSR